MTIQLSPKEPKELRRTKIRGLSLVVQERWLHRLHKLMKSDSARKGYKETEKYVL